MKQSQIRNEMEMTVKWGDCDAAGITYYAKNFEWFTDARMALLGQYGFPYMETFHDNGIALVCLKADCEYKKMIRPMDSIVVRTCLTRLERTRMEFSYEVINANSEVAAWGSTSHTYVDNSGNPFNIQKRFPALWDQLQTLLNQ